MKTLVGVLVLLVAMTACGEGSTPVGVGPGAAGPTGVYVSQSGHELVEGTRVRVEFTDDGRLLASAGCNTMSGPVETGGGKVVVRDLSVTEMGCDPARHAQDEWLAGLLTASPAWRMDGERLVLTANDTELVMARETVPPLLGTTWVVDTLVEGEVASSVPTRATLTFSADRVAVDTGCNTGGAIYRMTGNAIVFEPPVLTRMACAPEVMAVEDAIVAVMDGKAEVSTDGQTMTLSNGAKGIRMTAG
ncbi:META domain-containing protein [Actinokineospora sp. UTMC 2448]|uniref:META domain-containing protein n=1 Tax=Actinokineospora sp. UTMC 2448 TaxID=2268449 RepID=UPI002164E996|nr:META domain-containing protein [Actinokineospora sp. UTMC 2448]UVS78823.1 heat-inducible protein [Actinokineospora sp. UTMC 2448]